jgi:hypothetical protein
MNILFHDNYVDMIGPLAAQHGMTREEYIAYFHSVMVVSEMIDQNKKDIAISEKYQTYGDYSGPKSRWGTPEDLKQDALISVKHVTPTFDDKWIESITDQSDEQKGIKFEIKVSSGDIVHAFKLGSWRGSWEFYLNKKKKSKEEIKEYLTMKLLSPYDIWRMNFDGLDRYAAYSDDHRVWSNAGSHEQIIKNIYAKLSSSDQKKAYKYYTQSKYVTDPVNFVDFKGV